MSTVAIISICSYFWNVSRRSLIDQNTKQVCPLSTDKKQWLLGVATKNKNKTELFLFISLAVETISATETIIERLGADNTDNESAFVVMWYQLSVSSNKPLLLHIVFLWHMRHDRKCYVVGGIYIIRSHGRSIDEKYLTERWLVVKILWYYGRSSCCSCYQPQKWGLWPSLCCDKF